MQPLSISIQGKVPCRMIILITIVCLFENFEVWSIHFHGLTLWRYPQIEKLILFVHLCTSHKHTNPSSTIHSNFFHSKNSKNLFKCSCSKFDSISSNYHYLGCQKAIKIEKRSKFFWRPKQRPDMEKIQIFMIFSAF